MREEGIVEHARTLGETVIGPRLRELAQKHPVIGEVRGLGVFWALDLVTDRATREPLAPYGGTSEAMGVLTKACVSRGLLPFTNFNRMHVVPPCNISEDEALEGLAIVDEAFAEIDRYLRRVEIRAGPVGEAGSRSSGHLELEPHASWRARSHREPRHIPETTG